MKFTKFTLLFLLSVTITAQIKKPTESEYSSLPNTVENQFLKIFKKGNSWHEYKMVKKTEFISFQKNVLDSISAIKKDIVEKNAVISTQKSKTISLNDTISKLKVDLNIALEKEDSISLLGLPIEKSFYNTILFSLILILLAALLLFIFKFKNSSIITNNAKKNLETVEQELDSYRKKSIEKEQKLRRQLQDEINKQRGV